MWNPNKTVFYGDLKQNEIIIGVGEVREIEGRSSSSALS